MARNAWLTPDNPPGDLVCLRVFCPDGDKYRAALRGAILLLAQSENWEEFGAQSVGDVAQAFDSAYVRSQPLERCMPVGAIISFAGNVLPSGFLWCDGASYSETDYPELFTEIGATYGSSGAGVFNVPDLRGRVVVGAGAGSGLTNRALASSGGAESVVLTEQQLASHQHSVNAHAHTTHSHLPAIAQLGVGSPVSTPGVGGGNTGSASPDTDGAGSDEAHENMPPFIALNYIIRYR